MKVVIIIICMYVLFGCATNQDNLLNPTRVQIYPDEQISLATSEVFGIRQIGNGNLLVFAVATDFRSEPRQISVIQLDKEGHFLNRIYISEIDAYPTNILGENGQDEFEVLCSPTPPSNRHILVKVTMQDTLMNVSKQIFGLDCLLEDCGMMVHALKRNNQYITLNIGVDVIGDTIYSKVYIQQIDASDLTQQSQISEQNFNPESVLGLAHGDYNGLLSYRDIFFIRQIGGQLLYHAPREDRLALRYLNTEISNFYTSQFFFMADFQDNPNNGNYGTIFQDRTQSLPPHETFVVADFRLQTQQDQGEIEQIKFMNDTANCLNCKPIDLEYDIFSGINPQKKLLIRYDQAGNMYLGATTQTGQTLIHNLARATPYTFGSGNPQYELADFLVTPAQIILVGLTTLKITKGDPQLNGKRAPFLIMIPKSELDK